MSINPMNVQKEIAWLKKNWNQLTFSEIEAKVHDLQKWMHQSPTIAKEIEHLAFQCQFPLAVDMQGFVKKIQRLAKQVMNRQSTLPLEALNERQQGEILRQVQVGG